MIHFRTACVLALAAVCALPTHSAAGESAQLRPQIASPVHHAPALPDTIPTWYSLALLVNGDVLNIHGGLVVDGDVEVNGAGAEIIAGHVTPGHTVNPGFAIAPPAIYTDAAHFPTATYYSVRGDRIGPVAHIFNSAGMEVTGAHNMSGIISYNSAGGGTFTYNFTSTAFNSYFDGDSGYFPKSPGTTSVVVNFGEIPVNPVTAHTNLAFNGGAGSIHATVINTRFVGVTAQDRLQAAFWVGGTTAILSTLFEPDGGLALIGYDLELDTDGLGTASWPALVYLTHDLLDTHGNARLLVGSLVILNNFVDSHGNGVISYDPDSS